MPLGEMVDLHIGSQYCAKCICWKTQNDVQEIGICNNEDSVKVGKRLLAIDGCVDWKPITLTK